MSVNRGEEVHGQMADADASAGTEFDYFSQDGNDRTIDVREVLMVTDFSIISVPGGAVEIRAFKNGETDLILFGGTVVANGGAAKALTSPFAVPRGYVLQVIAPAGQVDAQIEGYIIH